MLDMSDPQTYWLNFTNIVLGLVTLVCCVVIGRAVLKDVLASHRKHAQLEADDHAFALEGLGLTMADGGEKVDEPKDK